LNQSVLDTQLHRSLPSHVQGRTAADS